VKHGFQSTLHVHDRAVLIGTCGSVFATSTGVGVVVPLDGRSTNESAVAVWQHQPFGDSCGVRGFLIGLKVGNKGDGKCLHSSSGKVMDRGPNGPRHIDAGFLTSGEGQSKVEPGGGSWGLVTNGLADVQNVLNGLARWCWIRWCFWDQVNGWKDYKIAHRRCQYFLSRPSPGRCLARS
jgi:hypothetical protein